ncbi:hypothetical protein F2Q68_00021480 [Brassica cretica]|uniref:Uncharacterized protein n=1 Tax=Brassica cretica TaxID=69181 RepID=A0A8S9FVJ3_BRACR|nr:hypothetical protein F2Q68_00021480 [Brassica cretica]
MEGKGKAIAIEGDIDVAGAKFLLPEMSTSKGAYGRNGEVAELCAVACSRNQRSPTSKTLKWRNMLKQNLSQ